LINFYLKLFSIIGSKDQKCVSRISFDRRFRCNWSISFFNIDTRYL